MGNCPGSGRMGTEGKGGLVGYPQLSHLTLDPKVQNPSSGGRRSIAFSHFVCLFVFFLNFVLNYF